MLRGGEKVVPPLRARKGQKSFFCKIRSLLTFRLKKAMPGYFASSFLPLLRFEHSALENLGEISTQSVLPNTVFCRIRANR